jgi:hypothetical protein
MATPKGLLFWWTNSNGQDLYLQDNIWLTDEKIDLTGFEIVDEELASKYELIEEA